MRILNKSYLFILNFDNLIDILKIKFTDNLALSLQNLGLYVEAGS